MSQSAQVHSVEALRDFQDALYRFRQDATKALDSVAAEIRRTSDWLADQLKFWQAELRRREDEVTQAKSELARRKMMKFFDREPDTTEQEKALRIAQERRHEAEEKIRTCRRWGPEWQRAVDDYQGPARQLAGMIEADLARAVALLGRRLEALEAYLSMPPPTAAMPPAPPAASETEGNTP